MERPQPVKQQDDGQQKQQQKGGGKQKKGPKVDTSSEAAVRQLRIDKVATQELSTCLHSVPYTLSP